MLAHVKRIGMAQVTVAPFFLDFQDMRVDRQLCILQDAHGWPLPFTFQDNFTQSANFNMFFLKDFSNRLVV
jgi:hypothetical protein